MSPDGRGRPTEIRHYLSPTARRSVSRPAVIATVTIGLIAVGIWSSTRSDAQPDAIIPVSFGAAKGRNVLLITLDTLRADRLGCYGCGAVATPNLDQLAATGLRIVNVSAAAPLTLPSHSSIMTGLDPPRHGVRENGLFRLTDDHTTLAEQLNAAGYETAAFVGAFVLDGRYGLAQGFNSYDDDLSSGLHFGEPERRGSAVVDSAITWLDHWASGSATKPFFSWVHLFDAHAPYVPPEPYATRYSSQPYLGEIAFVDEQVGRLIAWLRENSRLDQTLIVVTADHAESLGQHSEETHSLFVYESTMAVPMIWSCPGLIAGPITVSDRLAGIVDVTPTILDLLGLQGRPNFDGISLLRDHPGIERTVYVESLMPELRYGWSPLFGLRRLADKYIEAPTPEYYNLTDDPQEMNNLFETHPGGDALRGRLRARMETYTAAASSNDATLQPNAEELEKLASLGYAVSVDPNATGSGWTGRHRPGRRDPKVMVHLYHDFRRAEDLLAIGGCEEAATLLHAIVTDSPGNGSAWASFGLALSCAGRLDEALPAILRAIELQPAERHWAYLARLQLLRGDDAAFDESVTQLEQLDPDDGEAALLRGEREMKRKRYTEAIRYFTEARRRDPNRLSVQALTAEGKARQKIGDQARARQTFESALALDPSNPDALEALVRIEEQSGNLNVAADYARRARDRRPLVMRHTTKLAELLLRTGHPDDAVAVMNAMAERRPDDRKSHANLGKLLADLHRYDEAVASLRRAISLSPKYPFARRQLGIVFIRQGRLDDAMEQFREILATDPTDRRACALLLRALVAAHQLDEALDWLERSGSQCVDLTKIAADPELRDLAKHPRFKRLQQKPR